MGSNCRHHSHQQQPPPTHHYTHQTHQQIFPSNTTFTETPTQAANVLSAQTTRTTLTTETHTLHLATPPHAHKHPTSCKCNSRKLQSLQAKLTAQKEEIEDLKLYVSILQDAAVERESENVEKGFESKKEFESGGKEDCRRCRWLEEEVAEVWREAQCWKTLGGGESIVLRRNPWTGIGTRGTDRSLIGRSFS